MKKTFITAKAHRPLTAAGSENKLDRASFQPPKPPFRRLRGFAIDPSLATNMDTVSISQMTLSVPWEDLQEGPAGGYLEVIDFDPASACFYEPIHLDDPRLLAQNGLAPSEGTPQFHQQMVYAVASLTIDNFEESLGRRTLWRPRSDPKKGRKDDSIFVPRLRIYPHALRERNAYYTPEKIALLFGYFRASEEDPADHMPGGMVFTCLSHDIIAHETTHALLDGMSRSYLQPTNPDVLAFHEGFADIIALFQHFTFPEILQHQIATTRGDIRNNRNLLGELAGQFGRGVGMRGALRSAIGQVDANGIWQPIKPDPNDYVTATEPHMRGAILVAAVFDAFLAIYERRSADLIRLATRGSGVLEQGALHPDLVHRLAEEAAKSAQHVLGMCIRALDYCPPIDISFGEFLRAIVTADYDLVPNDDLNYRVSFIEAFRRRGIFPQDMRTLGVESLIWRGPDNDECRPSPQLEEHLLRLRNYANDNFYKETREKTFRFQREMRMDIHGWLTKHVRDRIVGPADAAYLGLDPNLKGFEVRSARFAYRTSPDGGMVPQLILTLLQEQARPVDAGDPRGEIMPFFGGCTLIGDLRQGRIRYCIRKNSTSKNRLARQQAFASEVRDHNALYFGGPGAALRDEPFAIMHRGL
jgi:hypothetical protein